MSLIPTNKRVILAITGASGAIYGEHALKALNAVGAEVHLVISKAGARTLKEERGLAAADLAEQAAAVHAFSDIGAPIASGSFRCAGRGIQ